MQSSERQTNLCIFLSSSFDKIESYDSTIIPCCKMKRAPASVHCPVIWVCTMSQKFTHKMYFASPDTAPKLLAIVVPAEAKRSLNCQAALEHDKAEIESIKKLVENKPARCCSCEGACIR